MWAEPNKVVLPPRQANIKTNVSPQSSCMPQNQSATSPQAVGCPRTTAAPQLNLQKLQHSQNPLLHVFTTMRTFLPQNHHTKYYFALEKHVCWSDAQLLAM
jgi:hypothetical protein